MSKHILLVDDDALLRRSLGFNLRQAGYRPSTAEDAETALAMARRDPPDLILLDIELPGIDGLSALRQIEAQLSVPVIFLTARRGQADQVLGLEAGGADYVTKPFDLDVLLARIKSVLRRAPGAMGLPEERRALVVGDLQVDPDGRIAWIGGRPVELSPREFDLLYELASDAGHVLSVDDLLARIWGADYAGEPQVVYVHMRWLREKLEDDAQHPRRIVTIRGVGYRLDAQET